MFQDTQPAALRDAEGPDPWAPFRVTHSGEIVALLRQVRDSSAPLVLSAPDGASISTTLWALDPHNQRINFTAEEGNPQLQHVVASDESTAVGYLDSVKLQFDLTDLVLVRGARSCALQATLPRVLYRFQRRSAYRVRTLERNSPTARLRHPAIPEMALALRVLDVSVGGCALFLPRDVPPIEPGVRLQRVEIELDADTRFLVAMQIQHLGSIPNSDRGLRIGCEWVQLEPSAERALQRYIDQTQKRRRLLSLD
jgi:c-di-GMP-binding flagellar brake protein YcgR